MYNTKANVTFLGYREQSFKDSAKMLKIDFYVDNEVDSYFIQATNPLAKNIPTLKPMQTYTIEVSWNKRDNKWSHRLNGIFNV